MARVGSGWASGWFGTVLVWSGYGVGTQQGTERVWSGYSSYHNYNSILNYEIL